MDWKNLGEKPVVDTPWFRLNLAEVELPGGRRLDHYVLRLPPVVLAAVLDRALIAGGQIRSAVTAATLMLLRDRRTDA